MHAGMCVPPQDTQQSLTPSSSGQTRGTAIYGAKYQRRSRTGTCQDSATGKPASQREPMAGRWRCATLLGAPRRRELTGLVADAGVVGKAKASESQDELRWERQPVPGERRSLYFAQHPDFMGRPHALGRAGASSVPFWGRRENANFRFVTRLLL